MGLGLFELAILLFVVFLILGPKRISAVFSSLKRGTKDFVDEFQKTDRKSLDDEDNK
jgi:sec-independent protein translocase protein TatA